MSSCSCNDTVGFRFHPTDKELIDHYLWNKALGRDSAVQAVGEVLGDLCDWEPRELTRFSVRSNDQTWYLFGKRNHSKRVKRITKLGFWKLTGKHRSIKAEVGIGTKKTLVFYEGRVPKGKWTPWVIHEYTLPHTLPNQKGFFLCKLKRKDDENAGISSCEEAQPSNVADDKIFDNSSDINVDELLAQLGEKNGSNDVEDEVASSHKPQTYAEQVPYCNAASGLYNLYDEFDGVQNQSSTNEQNGELYLVSSPLQFRMHEEHSTCNDLSFFCGSNGYFDGILHQSSTNEQDDGILHQSSTNEQDDEIQHQSSTNEQDNVILHKYSTNNEIQHQSSTNEQADEIQHQSSTNEQDDDFWNSIFVNDDDVYLDQRSNELFVGSESSDLLIVRDNPIDLSRKRPRVDDGGSSDVIETEVSQARVKTGP
ncbi:hypothetical protein REPUB_Repub17cG0135700 [Reevesia pubescens]